MELFDEEKMAKDILRLTKQIEWKSLVKFLEIMQNDIRRSALMCETLKDLGECSGRDQALEQVINIETLIEIVEGEAE